MQLQLGQIIIWNGYQQIVVQANPTHARIATRSAKVPLTSCVVERDLDAFFGNLHGQPLNKPEGYADDLCGFMACLGEEDLTAMKAEITAAEIELEDASLRKGDVVKFEAYPHVVVAACKDVARLLRLDGKVSVVANDGTLERLLKTLTQNISVFLSAQADDGVRAGLVSTITQQEKSEIMKTKNEKQTKSAPRGGLYAEQQAAKKAAKSIADAARYEAKKAAKLAKAAAKSEKAAAKPAAVASRARNGRAAFTRGLAHDLKLSVEEIHKQSKAKFPNSDMTTTKRLVESERANGGAA